MPVDDQPLPASLDALTRNSFIFRCSKPREARDLIGRLFERRFDLEIANRPEFDFTLQHFQCGDGISVTRMMFGAEVTVHIERVERFMVQMPIAGRNDLVLDGNGPLLLSNRMFSVINPGQSVKQRRDRDCQMVLVRFDQHLLTRCLAAQAGVAEANVLQFGPLEFASGMSAGQPSGSAWRRLMSFVLVELNKRDSLFRSPISAMHAGHLMISTLLLHQPHNYTGLLAQPQADLPPRILDEACAWLETNAHRPITVHDLSHAVNRSSRSVYDAFKKHLSHTPMSYLKHVRLEKVRQDLLIARGRKSVTTIAMDWGFSHLGRFARDYRARFGELPSETLNGHRRR
jgi:AraC-like DNA-binding protein